MTEDPASVMEAFTAAVEVQLHQVGADGGGQPAIAESFAAAWAAVYSGQQVLLGTEHLLQRVRKEFSSLHLPQFCSGLAACNAREGEDFTQAYAAAAAQLCAVAKLFCHLLRYSSEQALQQPHGLQPEAQIALLNLEMKFRYRIGADVLVATRSTLPGSLHQFYEAKLNAMAAAMDEEDGSMQELSWASGMQEVAECMQILTLQETTQAEAGAAVAEHLTQHLTECTAQNFDSSVIEAALQYSSSVYPKFLELVYLPKDGAAALLEQWQQRIRRFVWECVGSLRIQDMFDIVVDYPDSQPALKDLHDCLRNVRLHRRLISQFKKATCDRLLHPGAATADIIQQYVSTIRSLQHVDPSGVVLDAVSAPIREYLRTRKDTTRCIVIMLTGDGSEAGLSSLLTEADAAGHMDGRSDDAITFFDGPDADEQALLEVDRWEPDPVVSGLSQKAGGGGSDAISLLVGIYGSKELFVKEYKTMLAERLLAKSDYDCNHELRTLELLKLRFGEASLHAAEVMLRDLAESKRINTNVKSVSNTATPLKKRHDLVSIDALDATIVSELFWPQLPQDDFKLPPQVKGMLDTYAHKYHSVKAPRVLQWKPNLGTVSLDLIIGDRQMEFNVSPFHASVLLHLQQRQEWTPAELSHTLGVSPDALRRKLVFWIQQGVVSEIHRADGMVLIRRNDQLQSPAGLPGDAEAGMEVDEGVTGMDMVQQEMAKLEPYIVGMLTNFDSLPLERIHNMLKMFVSDPPYDRPLDELAAYMGKLVAEDKVVLEGGVYKRVM